MIFPGGIIPGCWRWRRFYFDGEANDQNDQNLVGSSKEAWQTLTDVGPSILIPKERTRN
jgi:hypothetical protein